MPGKQSDIDEYLLDVDEERSGLEQYLTAGVQKAKPFVGFVFSITSHPPNHKNLRSINSPPKQV
jgi:hypothetical protein